MSPEAQFDKPTITAKLKRIHKNHWKTAYEKLLKKAYNLRQKLQERGEEHDLETTIETGDLHQLLHSTYGQPCPYCKAQLKYQNMSCDHIVPLEQGGTNNLQNLRVVCKRCNTRKGPLTHQEYTTLLRFLQTMPALSRSYVLRKLAKGDY